jgi:hypothetical protein
MRVRWHQKLSTTVEPLSHGSTDFPTRHDHELLPATVSEWFDGCNIASNLAWENKHTQAGVRNIATDTVQADTKLGSQHSILACHEVAGSIQSWIKKRNKSKRATQPYFTSK